MEIREKIRKRAERKKNRKKGLHVIFVRYLAGFCLAVGLLVILVFAAFSICAATGRVRLANWMQTQIEQVSEEIVHTDESPFKLLPEECRYGVYSEDGKYLYGNFAEEDVRRAFSFMKEGRYQADSTDYYRYLKRDNGEVCIVRYHIFATFSNPVLQNLFPNAERLFILLFLFLFFIQTIGIAKGFGYGMKKRLAVLNQVTEMIRIKNLDFDREVSDIQEIDEILESLFQMKEGLKEALEEQWRIERYKNEQVAALAHDIKTPLTVIQGNAELASEESEGIIREYNQYILEGVTEIREYLNILQDTLRFNGNDGKHCETGLENGNRMQEICLNEFADRIIKQAEMLTLGKGIQVTEEYQIDTETAVFDVGKLYRAVINAVSNSAEYCPENGRIHIAFFGLEEEKKVETGEETSIWPEGSKRRCGKLRIRISDSGPGFSKEMLVHGTEQFYRGDKSRSGKGHYGMGLYIARKFAESQGGSLALGESKELGGAEVVIEGEVFF